MLLLRCYIGIPSHYLDLFYLFGWRSDCGYVGTAKRILLALLMVVGEAIRFQMISELVDDDSSGKPKHRWIRPVWKVAAIVVLISPSSETSERLVADYWSQTNTTNKCVIYIFHFIGCLFTVACVPEFIKQKLIGSTLALSMFYIFAFWTWVPLTIICLSNAIRDKFLGIIETEDIDLRGIFAKYAEVNSMTDAVSDSIRYRLIAMFLFLGTFTVNLFMWVIHDEPGYTVKTDRLVSFVLVSTLLVYFLALVAYPSMVVDKGDVRLRKIVANNGFTDGDRKYRDNILACLYLNSDQTGLRMFGALINKDILTLAFRALYLILGYVFIGV